MSASVAGLAPLGAPFGGRSRDHCGGNAHIVQFYENERFLVESVAEFLRAGIRAAEPIVLIATGPHRKAFEQELAASGLDLGSLSEEGLYVALDAEETLSAILIRESRTRSASRRCSEACSRRRPPGARADGFAATARWSICCGEGGGPARRSGSRRFWNEIGRRYSFSLLCAYAMENFRQEQDARGFEAVCRTHARVVPTESYVSLEDADSRSRAVSTLQQRAVALESEVASRKVVEESLREALRIRDDFLCLAGHELRTPLTVLRLQLASLLSSECSGAEPRTERRLAKLAAQTERLAALAERLLDVSQLGETLALEPTEEDSLLLVRDSVDAFADGATAAGCRVTVLGDGGIVGRWDRARLEQVVQDLLSNAFKFGRGAPVRVFVRGLLDRAVIVVRDGGIGVPLEDQERIFDWFDRRAPTSSFGGLGLGLWIARRVVEAHGGGIRVDSEPGQGATFTVTLPYDVPAAR